MSKPRVLISDSMSSLAVSVFEERGVEVVSSSKLSPEELKHTIGGRSSGDRCRQR